MRKALHVAQRALKEGEVPVGCIIVLREDTSFLTNHNTAIPFDSPSPVSVSSSKQKNDGYDYRTSPHVILSHGSNQVNATRDATRHAECIAIDRLLTGGIMSDQCRLPRDVFESKKKMRSDVALGDCSAIVDESNVDVDDYNNVGDHVDDDDDVANNNVDDEDFHDTWINIPNDEKHWKNNFGWKGIHNHRKKGSGSMLFTKDIFSKCDLYVTCEPCIMVSDEMIDC